MNQDRFLYLHAKEKRLQKTFMENIVLYQDMLIQLGVNSETVHMNACRIEHVISDESFKS
jgi:Mn-dependent DtxR family transcriptional regulator